MKVDPRALTAYQNTVSLTDRATRVKGNAQVDAARGKGASTSVARAEDARVTISPEARQLAATSLAPAADTSQASGVDAAKVAALKEKLANGTLELDSHVIAKNLVDRTG